jgi:hypothetical protein
MAKNKANPYIESLNRRSKFMIFFGKCCEWLFAISIIMSKTITGVPAALAILTIWISIYVVAWMIGISAMCFYKLRNIYHPFYSLSNIEVLKGLKLRAGSWHHMIFGIIFLSGLIYGGILEAIK